MTVMNPAFSPRAAIVSAGAFLVSLAGVILSLPNSVLAQAHINPTLGADIMVACLIVTGLSGSHLGFTRSLLPSVDGTQTVEAPSDSTVVTIPSPEAAARAASQK